MNRDSIRVPLLGMGYFPKELPPTFTTLDFGAYSGDIIEAWKKAGIFKIKEARKLKGGNKKRDAYHYAIDDTEAELISTPKKGFERRSLHLTHPIPQALLVEEIAMNWKIIQRWVTRQVYSLDEIRVSNKYDRSVKGINFDLHREKNSYIEAESDWIVKTDITRFYPSIYTHSIPWAAYGKEAVKAKLELYKGSLADRLDALVRACNRNQTIGIPIGPETSRIIAEVISARIDTDVAKSTDLPAMRADRLQDDWTVGLPSLDLAERTLAQLTSIYRSYGLDINGGKTSIERIVATRTEEWRSELGAFLSHRPGTLHGARLRELLTLSLRLQAENPMQPVLNYALAVIESSTTSPDDVRDLESFLLKAAVVAPGSMDRVCRLVLNLNSRTGKISKERVGSRFQSLIERSIDNQHHYEVIWLLHTLRGLRRSIVSRRLGESMETLPSGTISLILMDMKSQGSFRSTLPVREWENVISEESVRRDWTWLLAYEGFRKGWLTDKKGLLAKPFFRAMAERNVVFYDPKRNVRPSETVLRKKRVAKNRNLIELRKFFLQVRGTMY